MTKLIGLIKGKELMELWGKDEEGLLDCVKMGLPAYEKTDIEEPLRIREKFQKEGLDRPEFKFAHDHV